MYLNLITMRSVSAASLLLIFFLVCSCDIQSDEEPVVCLPVSMSATIIQGSSATKIIADFHYQDQSGLIDHITWSNHRTDYFTYDDENRLRVFSQMLVKEKAQEEMWFNYDGQKVTGAVKVHRNLDFTYLEPVDSSFAGHIEYHYEGKYITEEKWYSAEGSVELLEMSRTYTYDGQGNILSRTTTRPDSDPETVELTYDANRHPFSAIHYYFTGESFVNYPLTRTSEFSGLDYNYEVRANAYGYPETVYETLGSTNTQMIRFTYDYR
jgi:hypothetical protein